LRGGIQRGFGQVGRLWFVVYIARVPLRLTLVFKVLENDVDRNLLIVLRLPHAPHVHYRDRYRKSMARAWYVNIRTQYNQCRVNTMYRYRNTCCKQATVGLPAPSPGESPPWAFAAECRTRRSTSTAPRWRTRCDRDARDSHIT